MLKYLTVPVTPFQQNCSILWCDETHKAAIIDPGGDLDLLLAEVARLGLTLEQIWLTHAHIDHAGGTAELAEKLNLPIIGPHPGDQFWIDGLPQQSQMFGFPPAGHFTPTRWLADGDTVLIGRETIYRNNERVGWLSSGGFGHSIGKSIGMGYVRNAEGVNRDYLLSGEYSLEVASDRVPCQLHLAPLYDPTMTKVKC